MSYKKKVSSPVIEASQARLTALSSIDKALDLGNGLTVAKYQAAIQDVQAKLAAYNTSLAQADEDANNLLAAEKELKALSGRMLAGVSAKYGKDSNEYEKAGGTRASEIKYAPRKKAASLDKSVTGK